MGEVFLADISRARDVVKLGVVKRLRPDVQADDESMKMFLDEGRLAARLAHPNVISTFEVGNDDKGPFIVMEFLEGQPLNRILKRMEQKKRRFPLPLHLHIIVEILSALHYAHELTDYDQSPLHVIHRDVTPHNVFVLYSGPTKLVDFGIAKARDSLAETQTGFIKGKTGYMAPEQTMTTELDRRLDVFAVGVILWEALTNQRFYAGLLESKRLAHLLSLERAPAPSEAAKDVPPALENVCLKAIALERDERYQTAAEMQLDLEAAIVASGLEASTRDVARFLDDEFATERAELAARIEEFCQATDIDVAIELPDFVATSEVSPRPVEVPPRPPESPRRSRSYVVGSSALVVALALGGGGLAWRARARAVVPETPAPSAIAAASTSAVAPETPPPAPTEEIRIDIAATPATAQITLDGAPVANPYRARHAKDPAHHTVRITARGYEPRVLELTMAQDMVADIALSPVAAVRPRAPAPAPPPKRPSRPVSSAPAPVTAPRIDATNPWR